MVKSLKLRTEKMKARSYDIDDYYFMEVLK